MLAIYMQAIWSGHMEWQHKHTNISAEHL